MSRYGKVERRTWADGKFRSLSQDAKFLWLYLLTTDQATSLPGLLKLGKAQLSEALEWLPERLAKGFGELFRKGMAKADWEARVVWLPNAIKYNLPENPNVVKGWVSYWDLVPECALKDEAFSMYSDTLKGLGEPFAKPFAERCRKGSLNGMPNQEQDQEQEPEQEEREAAPQTEPATPTVSGKRARTRTLAHPCPPDWHPNQTHLDIAKQAGHGGAWVSEQATRMRDWAEAKGSKANCADWDARFRNWIRSEADKPSGGSRFQQPALIDQPDPSIEAARRIRETNALTQERLRHIPRPVRSSTQPTVDTSAVQSFLGGFGKVPA